jgi:AhpD family alkylhydroperoxidase
MFAKVIAGAFALTVAGSAIVAPTVASAADAMVPQDAEAAYKDIEATMGGVPSFIKMFPKAALPGAWAEEKALELSTDTALSPKEKSLISLAVGAQIPCQYCVWADTMNAKRAGATDEEIGEAVAMAALTRHWSTIFNGLQVDFETFKMEMGGDMAAQ